MTTRQFTQTPPDKANELFDRLLATSDTAVKTRERLFAELKAELELLAAMQEQHLFPILRENGMGDLVEAAAGDNLETDALLTQLDAMPKTSGEFLGKVAELRAAFQRHIRDDRKELLPAVLEVLSAEEAKAVAEKVENDMAQIEEARRAEARLDRDGTPEVAGELAHTMQVATEGAQTVARTLQEAVQDGLGAVTELARLSTSQAVRALTAPGRVVQGADQASQNFRVVAQSGTVLARGVQDVSREWLALSQKRLERNIEGLSNLARCRSVQDVIEVQTSLIRDNFEQILDNSRRIAELAVQVADDAARAVSAGTQAPARATRAA